MKVKDVLKQKGPEVFSIYEEKTVADAIKMFTHNNIGLLIVLSLEAKVVGTISERDIIRKLATDPEGCLTAKVKDVMTKQVLVVEPEDDLEYAEQIMTQNRCRHLPVIQNDVLVGLISIGDIIKFQLKESQTENKYLKSYVAGGRA
ncbi:MAG: CBS domain-containing protein [Ignavibacteria bacterium]|nr:CBS domain-containing protein [Ignavibacteria bacterium]